MTGSETLNPASPDGAPAFYVGSEVGRLRKVLVHRPDLSLQRLTPSNVRDLLFDDVLWVRRAREQHDVFVNHLRDRGVEVYSRVYPCGSTGGGPLYFFNSLLRHIMTDVGDSI